MRARLTYVYFVMVYDLARTQQLTSARGVALQMKIAWVGQKIEENIFRSGQPEQFGFDYQTETKDDCCSKCLFGEGNMADSSR